MKKTLFAVAAFAAMGVFPAIAADLGRPAPVYKAPPPPAPVYTWTGCYVGGGGGYGMWNQDIFAEQLIPPTMALGSTTTSGGRGWFGTVQGGCDYQFANNWVIGAFGDWDFDSLSGTASADVDVLGDVAAQEKQHWAWSVGGRLGWVALPQFLTYISAGYTEAHFNAAEVFLATAPPLALGTSVPAKTFNGWFFGAGYEYGISFLPGLFWKTEYRYSSFHAADIPELVDATGLPTGDGVHATLHEQTIRTELVWRFNWSSGSFFH